jgi:malonyl-CoA/methylmalonyl-CoA synthetase
MLPLFHTHGLFVAAHCVIASGSSMVLIDAFDPAAVIAALPESTVVMGVPTHYVRLLAEPTFDSEATRGVRLFTSGSAPMLVATHGEFQARTGQVILERYGMTETCMLTSNPLDGERRPGTVGLPLPGVDVRLSGGDPGGIEVRGPNVLAGYWRRPELRSTEFTDDGWFITGDLGHVDADGYLEIVGRSKDLIISGGLNVIPKEVEEVLDSLDGVLESAVVGRPNADFGEVVVAVVVGEPGATLDPEVLRLKARERLAGFKVPKQVLVVDELPRNVLGKVEKARIRGDLAGLDADPNGLARMA